ncbi:MAG: type II secretion system protein GspG [Opitutaceae bacterium]|jgi:hypothetical protein|nr:type II secretion system protein GspG [Opitutaceae bacterium]
MTIETVPPGALTETRMHRLKIRLLDYARFHNRQPASLDELPPDDEHYGESGYDAWKRPITFRISPEGIVTLQSPGRDGKAGGTGKDADITRSFRLRDARGQWNKNAATDGWLSTEKTSP